MMTVGRRGCSRPPSWRWRLPVALQTDMVASIIPRSGWIATRQAFAQDAAEAPRGYDREYVRTTRMRGTSRIGHMSSIARSRTRTPTRRRRASFDDLSRSYHALRDDVQHSDSDYARRDLAPVTQAYLDVEDDMGGAGPSRYSDADDDRGLTGRGGALA